MTGPARKAELRVSEHRVLPDTLIFEVWYGGEFIAQVTGGDGPGVRVMSKHELKPVLVAGPINVVEIVIKAGGEHGSIPIVAPGSRRPA